MSAPDALEERALTPDDVTGGAALSRDAGWNQTERDWRMILIAGRGRGILAEGRLVATAAVLPYGTHLGWICMVLVAPEFRRRGLATRLMRWAIDSLSTEGRVAGLDATPAGREVYARLGFHGTLSLTRYESASPRVHRTSGEVRPAAEADRAAIMAMDAAVFGAERRAVMDALIDWPTDLALVAEDRGKLTGIALARGGVRATQIGPVLADDAATAVSLLSGTCARATGAVFVDVPDQQRDVARWLQDHGFSAQRTFTRMFNGDAAAPADLARTFGVAGPELA